MKKNLLHEKIVYAGSRKNADMKRTWDISVTKKADLKKRGQLWFHKNTDMQASSGEKKCLNAQVSQ